MAANNNCVTHCSFHLYTVDRSLLGSGFRSGKSMYDIIIEKREQHCLGKSLLPQITIGRATSRASARDTRALCGTDKERKMPFVALSH